MTVSGDTPSAGAVGAVHGATAAPCGEAGYNARAALSQHLRLVPDFPAPGILFEDLTPVLADAYAFRLIIDELADAAARMGADMIGGLDARGFLLGSAVAYRLGVGVLAIRKAGKLPPPVVSQTYELEYGTAALEIPRDAIPVAGKRVVLIDDVLATGGTLVAARELIESCGGKVTGHAVVLEVATLNGREKLADVPLVVVNHGTDSLTVPFAGH